KKWRAKHPLKIPTRAKATPRDRVTLIAYSSLHWRCTPVLHIFTSSHPLPGKDFHILTSAFPAKTFMSTHPHIVPHITTLLTTS
ncbi:hypothetical protein L873DRAFT_1810352, partial [Choiromyces venosus 120613-1]